MRIAVLGAALVLAACGDTSEPAREPAAAEPPSTPTVERPAMIEEPGLEGLGETDLAGIGLEGELACTFRRSEGQSPIFFGRGDVLDDASAEGAVKYDGTVRTLAMAGTGGYDAMADGARFEGEGLTLTIATAGDEPIQEEPQIAMESPIYPATLTFTAADQTEQAVQGLFECGP